MFWGFISFCKALLTPAELTKLLKLKAGVVGSSPQGMFWGRALPSALTLVPRRQVACSLEEGRVAKFSGDS